MQNHNNYDLHKLENEEKNLLGYELSKNKEQAYFFLIDYQNKFNEVYRTFINIFRKIFYMKKSNKNLKEEIQKSILELQKAEQSVLIKYKLLLFYSQLFNSNFNNADIYFEFKTQEEKKNFFDNLKKRKDLLENYSNQIKQLEDLKNRINSIYERIISMSCVDLTNK